MAVTFSKKRIVVRIFSDDGRVTSFEDFATKVSVKKVGGAEFASANVTIYGVRLETASRLTWATFLPNANKYHLIEIQAGAGSSLSLIFKGEITFCAVDLNDANPVLKIQAHTGGYFNLKPASPVSVDGTVSVADFVKAQVNELEGFAFENHGVDSQLNDCTISGSPIQKIRQAASQVGATLLIDDGKVVLMKSGETRNSNSTIPVIDKATGLIGYPSLTTSGVSLTSYFRPELQLGGLVRVNTIVPGCSGTWAITELGHELEAGNSASQSWHTTINGVFNGASS